MHDTPMHTVQLKLGERGGVPRSTSNLGWAFSFFLVGIAAAVMRTAAQTLIFEDTWPDCSSQPRYNPAQTNTTQNTEQFPLNRRP